MRITLAFAIVVASAGALAAQGRGATAATPNATRTPAPPATKRALRPTDIFRVRDVRDPRISPDGKWVAYTVTIADSARDKNDTDVWMASWDGKENIRITSTKDGESSPRWSPDGRYLSFVSSRDNGKGGQVWLLDRRGGEATRLTEIKGGVSSYEWSPDGTRLVLVVDDPEDEPSGDSTKAKAPKPIVLDRYHFKQDVQGYLGNQRSHLYLFDVATKTLDTLTSGKYDESNPSWSPDGKTIAFVSDRSPDPDKSINTDIYLIDARKGAEMRRLTTFVGEDNNSGSKLAWSPDGKSIAYVRGVATTMSIYDQYRVAVIPVAGGEPRLLTEALDRPVTSPTWSADGTSLLFLVTDDRTQYVARMKATGGAVEKLTTGPRVVQSLALGPAGKIAVLASTATEMPEVHALENGTLRPLTHQNDAWLAELQLGTTEGIEFTTPDGADVHAVMTRPAGASGKMPTLLRIHGGPTGQDQYSFNFERELFAANGYVVVSPNYRGSNGRGEKFMNAISGDWGNKEVVDVLAATDYVVQKGIADPDRLGIGGWSYGGITTDYTIATTPRFKAAISGAGSALQTSMYGVDQYILQYETELGPPWKNPDAWVKVSYPFYHADRIKTPTLFMVGEKDFNVPAIGSEQMYQALKSLGIDTQLIIYPNSFHGITLPSYRVDRLDRYLKWYDRYLKPVTQ
ncbi:MAG TPA: S9 family peptidase [Gemmatimonadaceae bacterium]|nr:S9 family peptidase [Gemmatimonadaceae bacterium]